MEKEIKLVPEQETKDNEIVELKDDDMSTIAAGDEIGRNILLDDISLHGYVHIPRVYLLPTSTN